jgi:hypothetical protein
MLLRRPGSAARERKLVRLSFFMLCLWRGVGSFTILAWSAVSERIIWFHNEHGGHNFSSSPSASQRFVLAPTPRAIDWSVLFCRPSGIDGL